MFLKIGKEVLNLQQVVRARYVNGVCTISMHAGDADIGFNHFYDGAEADLLWEHLTSPAICTDVLADMPAPVRP